jgi:hypothetical protein
MVELLGNTKWDVITTQQYSMLSGDATTYSPFAEKLTAQLKLLQPTAQIVVYQTWPYARGAVPFGQVGILATEIEVNCPDLLARLN